MSRNGWYGCCREFELDAINSAINNLKTRVIRECAPDHELTQDDLLQMFVPEELRQLAVDGFNKLLCSPATSFAISHEDRGMALDIRTIKPTFAVLKRPHKRREGWQANESAQKIDRWCEWYLERQREWWLVHAVWKELNNLCTFKRIDTGRNQLHVVRYLWPVVLKLLENGGERDAAAKLEKARPPEDIPTLHPALRHAMKVTSGTIMGALMIPAGDTPEQRITITVMESRQVFVKPWEIPAA